MALLCWVSTADLPQARACLAVPLNSPFGVPEPPSSWDICHWAAGPYDLLAAVTKAVKMGQNPVAVIGSGCLRQDGGNILSHLAQVDSLRIIVCGSAGRWMDFPGVMTVVGHWNQLPQVLIRELDRISATSFAQESSDSAGRSPGEPYKSDPSPAAEESERPENVDDASEESLPAEDRSDIDADIESRLQTALSNADELKIKVNPSADEGSPDVSLTQDELDALLG